MNAPLLEMRHVAAFYGTAQVLFGIDLAVAEGEIVAVLGRNGAGKSTTLKSIMRLGLRMTGSIKYDGHELSHRSTTSIARMGVGYVPEDRRIFPRMTTRENLLLGRHLARDGRPPFELDVILDTFPSLKPLLNRRGGVLSGGEQQLLTVARTLVGNPRLMLLDEPSEGLAPKILVQLRDAVAMVHRAYGVTVLLTEQNAMFALSLAHAVALIDSGRIVFRGTAAELRGQPELMHRYLGVQGEPPRRIVDTGGPPT